METYHLKFVLKSDAVFGRGDGVVGLVDAEVQHDELGCPFLNGRALKGILVNECADILACLPQEKGRRWQYVAQRLFGQPGSKTEDSAGIAIGNAQLPSDLRQALEQELTTQVAELEKSLAASAAEQRGQESDLDERYSLEKKKTALFNQFRIETLQSLTTIRYQTAMEASGVPKKHTLRSVRVILRGTPFLAALGPANFTEDDLALLATCVLAFRRAGTGRNRGHGRLRAELLDSTGRNVTDHYYQIFKREALA